MAKRKAKSQRRRRSKIYTGENAAVRGTTVTKITAEKRSRLGEWYQDNKQRLLSNLILVGLALIIFVVVWFFWRLIF